MGGRGGGREDGREGGEEQGREDGREGGKEEGGRMGGREEGWEREGGRGEGDGRERKTGTCSTLRCGGCGRRWPTIWQPLFLQTVPILIPSPSAKIERREVGRGEGRDTEGGRGGKKRRERKDGKTE